MERPALWGCLFLLATTVVAAAVRKPPVARPGVRKAPKGFEDPLTALARISGATKLPGGLTAQERATLAGIAQMHRRGNSKAASARWVSFVRASRGKKRAELDAAMLWVLRRAYLEPNTELRQKAQKARHLQLIETALRERRAALRRAAAKAKGGARVIVRTFHALPRFKPGETTRISWKKRSLSRSELAGEIAEVEAQQEKIRNERQMASSAFQNFDQKANQLYNLLSRVMKAMNEMRMGTVRNML